MTAVPAGTRRRRCLGGQRLLGNGQAQPPAPGSHLWLTLTEFGGIIVVAFTLAAILFKRTANA